MIIILTMMQLGSVAASFVVRVRGRSASSDAGPCRLWKPAATAESGSEKDNLTTGFPKDQSYVLVIDVVTFWPGLVPRVTVPALRL